MSFQKVVLLNLGEKNFKNHTRRSKFNAIIMPLEGSIKLFEALTEFSPASPSTFEGWQCKCKRVGCFM